MVIEDKKQCLYCGKFKPRDCFYHKDVLTETNYCSECQRKKNLIIKINKPIEERRKNNAKML